MAEEVPARFGSRSSRVGELALGLVIVNPAAGGGRGLRVWRQLEPRIRERLGGTVVKFTTGAGDAERLAREETPERGPLLVVGGDGTLHETINGLMAREEIPPLGVIPAGSGNDFARNAGIPLDPAAAFSRLAPTGTRRVDLGSVRYGSGGLATRRVFLNSVSVGLSVRANRLAQRIPHWGPTRLRYVLGGLGAILLLPRSRYRVRSGGRSLHDGVALNLTVANGPSFGGGMLISPGSLIRDGILELVVVGALGRLGALLALSRLPRGAQLGMRAVSVTPVRDPVEISATGHPLRFEMDGQEFAATGPLLIEPLPARLALLN